jgi:hypothetical protein
MALVYCTCTVLKFDLTYLTGMRHGCYGASVHHMLETPEGDTTVATHLLPLLHRHALVIISKFEHLEPSLWRKRKVRVVHVGPDSAFATATSFL